MYLVGEDTIFVMSANLQIITFQVLNSQLKYCQSQLQLLLGTYQHQLMHNLQILVVS